MIYLLYGEDDYLKQEFIHKIKKNFGEMQLGINYIQIDESNVSELISDIETPAFGYEKKLIIAKNTGLFKKSNSKVNSKSNLQKEDSENSNITDEKSKGKNNTLVDKIAKCLEENDIKDVELVFNEENIENNNLFKIISKIGTVKEFAEQNVSTIVAKLKSIANAYHVNIQDNVAQYLIECCGTNMQDLINEVRKLIEYAGQDGIIKKEDIDSLTVKKSESIIFDLTDNLGKKNIKESIKVLHNLINNKEPEQRILIMLYGHFKKLYIVKLSNGQNTAQYLKLKPNQSFLLNKYASQAKYFNLDELQQILESLIYIDEASKNGNLDIQVGLESVLCNYCS